LEPHEHHKTIRWTGDTKKVVSSFPAEVKRETGYALRFAQAGETRRRARRLKHRLREVMEIRLDDPAGTYRTCYTASIGDAIYVLHAFQKKARTGIATTRADIDLIMNRLKEATEYDARQKRAEGESDARQR